MAHTVRKEGSMKDTTQNLIQELRRGTLVLAVLSQLDEQQYGYSLQRLLADKGIEIEQSTLYPLLRRLEGQELLTSEWSVTGSRPRRYYQLSEQGKQTLMDLNREWQAMSKTINTMMGKDVQDES
jgi:PadR family transcriptional regulator PadR